MIDQIAAIKSQLVPVEQWLSNDALKQIYSAGYWNNIEMEKTKEWRIPHGSYDRCEHI